MIRILLSTILILFLLSCTTEDSRPDYVLVIHGGAGVIVPEKMDAEREREIRAALLEALLAGETILKQNGTSLDAVVASIEVLEDSPHFNAGKGAVFNSAGENELDASIMNGSDLNAGAVAGVQGIANPIRLARAVMEHSPHVLLSGEGAVHWALTQGMDTVSADYFYTERRWDQLQRKKKSEKHGTVGAVALDRHGHLAAGTSTGGRNNKHWGRVGDSPIIGAGTYANDQSCAVSATGAGEYFIRGVIAHDIAQRMEYLGETVDLAAHTVIHEKLEAMDGSGGVIVLGRNGDHTTVFNTAGMYRAYLDSDGNQEIKFYRE